MEITEIEEGILSLRIATDSSPYIDHYFLPDLSEAVELLERDRSAHVVLLEGGERYFSAGASRNALLRGDDATSFQSYVTKVPPLLLRIPVPTIAVMRGHAIGGGMVLGLWCDMAVLGEESMYGANFMQLGFTPGMGSTIVLEEALGRPLARELLFTGRIVKGRELRAAGCPIAHSILPRAQVNAHALDLARELVLVPREPLTLLKRTLADRRSEPLPAGLLAEAEMHRVVFGRAETRFEIAGRYVGQAE
jgi:polyketide biosynthesis enoyl-CoA hydratase PksI